MRYFSLFLYTFSRIIHKCCFILYLMNKAIFSNLQKAYWCIFIAKWIKLNLNPMILDCCMLRLWSAKTTFTTRLVINISSTVLLSILIQSIWGVSSRIWIGFIPTTTNVYLNIVVMVISLFIGLAIIFKCWLIMWKFILKFNYLDCWIT